MIERIVSGGQTGADRGGLDAAIALGIPHGGWCPKGRRAEDGPVPARYRLQEMPSRDYHARTRQNVLDSDGTVLFTPGEPTGGSALTVRIARACGKPLFQVDSRDLDRHVRELTERFRAWVAEHAIRCLNVAGARESKSPGIEALVSRFLQAALPHAGRAFPIEAEQLDQPATLLAAETLDAVPPSRGRRPPRRR